MFKNQIINEITILKIKQVIIGKYNVNPSFFIIISPGNFPKCKLFTKKGHMMPIITSIIPIIIIVFCISPTSFIKFSQL